MSTTHFNTGRFQEFPKVNERTILHLGSFDDLREIIPAPFDIATCMYHTGLDPFTGKPVESAKNLRDRKMQRALMQFFKPENYFEVREALIQAGRGPKPNPRFGD